MFQPGGMVLADWCLYKILNAFSLLMTWLESIRCFKMDDLMVLIVPLESPTG